jgi:tetratricopeptide (TPR) repeat protein
LFFDIYPREVYLEKFDPRRPLKKLYGSVEVLLSLAALAERSRKAGAGLYVLAVVHDKALTEAYRGKAVRDWLEGASFYVPQLNTPEFLAGVLKSYACPNENDCCLGKVDTKRLVSLISSHDAYTLVAKYTGLWLRESKCDAEKLEEALKSSLKPSKAEPKLYLAHYIWHVLLRGKGDLARKTAVPLLLHAYFGPVPVGVTYITKAVKNGVWRFLKPEELEGASLESLREDELEPIARWLAQLHEDLVEEALRDLAGPHREEDREPYKETLSGLMGALDWARGEVLKEGDKVFAELGVPEKDRGIRGSLLAFVNRRLAAVFKGGEVRRCWGRAALIAGHALAGHTVLPRREWLPEDAAEALGDALKPCAVDAYLTIDGVTLTLSIGVAQLAPIRELNILSPLADTETIDAARKTAERLLARWRSRKLRPPETFYALGLAALAAGVEVDNETADLLLYEASAAVQEVVHPAVVSSILATLRPLGEKAPHRYVDALAAASELEMLDRGTVEYIYDALQQLKDRLLEAGRLWPLVKAVDAYSNLLRKYSAYIEDRREEAVADMCRLYSEVRRHNTAAAPGGGLSAQCLLDAVARANVLTAALRHDVLAPLVQWHCGLGDLEKEAKDVMSVLDEAAARPEELRKIMENDTDFAEWVAIYSPIGDAGKVVEGLRTWFTVELARYKLNHALDERGELDAGKLEEAAEEFKKAAEMRRKLEDWRNYLTGSGLALRARVLAAKSWEELLERAEGFRDLWREAEKHLEPIARYLAAAAVIFGNCLVYLAVSGDGERTEKLLKEWRWLLNYVPEASVITRLMLRLFSVGEGAKLEEVVDVFEPELSSEFRPALLMLAGRLQRDEAPEECAKISNAQPPEAELCVDAVATAAGNRIVAERLRSVIEKVVAEAHLLLDKVDGRTLVEVMAPEYSLAHFAFMLLAAVEGRANAVRLHGLWGSVAYEDPMRQTLFRAVYENCGDLNSEGCRLALLKLYYYHF